MSLHPTLELRVLRLQLLMLLCSIVAWLGMLAQAIASLSANEALDTIGLFSALGGLLGLVCFWLLAAQLTGNSRDMLLTAIDDEHAQYIRATAVRIGFSVVLAFLVVTHLLAHAQILDFGVSHTSRLGVFLGLSSSLAAFVWAQRR